ncbi:MAG: thiamine pyrophosphate-dependent enzyme [Negativicutes bacterium]|nr:thiamine pyrophosphate-dependent enzyme [Negativicutes bacterium]
MQKIYAKSESLNQVSSPYCPGCLHGVAQKLLASALDNLGLREQTIAVMGVGCISLARTYFNMDMVPAAHGRAPAVATGVKRIRPDRFVFTYQGDGDLAAIGTSEIIHCANRGENITTLFINNATYGMTGGQMAPTTLVGQTSTTSPAGRDPKVAGYPIKMAEIIATLEAPAYVARFALNTPANILKAAKGIETAFRMQLENKGFSFVELLSNCPTNWHMKPLESLAMIENDMIPYYPLGEFKVRQ